jgi:hypothetical protein
MVQWMKSLSLTLNNTMNEKLSPTLNSTMNEKFVINTAYYSVLMTNFSSILLFSVGNKLFFRGTIQCWWQTFHSSYYSVLVTNFSFIVLFSVGDTLFNQKSLSSTLNSTMNETFVTNTERYNGWKVCHQHWIIRWMKSCHQHWIVRWMNSLSSTLYSTMNEKFVTNTE